MPNALCQSSYCEICHHCHMTSSGQAVSPRGGNFSDTASSADPTTPTGNTQTTPPSGTSHVIIQDPNASPGQMNSKTKTALANMLSNRLGNNNGASSNSAAAVSTGNSGGPIASGPGGGPLTVTSGAVGMADPTNNVVVEPSAAGTLRMMTAQHNAALNQSSAGGPRLAQELVVLQHQQQQQQK